MRAGRSCAGRSKTTPAVALEAEGDGRGRRRRGGAPRPPASFGLGARGLQELAARGGGEEQVGDDHLGAGRAGGGLDGADDAALDGDAARRWAAPGGREVRRSRGGGADAGQRLAAEAEGGDADQLVVVGQLGGGNGAARPAPGSAGSMPQPSSVTSIRWMPPPSARATAMRAAPASDGVLDQFLDHGGGALDDLAGGDAVDERLRQLADDRDEPGGGDQVGAIMMWARWRSRGCGRPGRAGRSRGGAGRARFRPRGCRSSARPRRSGHRSRPGRSGRSR